MENNLERIKIINTGVKAFTRCENKVPLHFHHIPSEAVDSVLKICTGIHTALAEADQRIFFLGGGGIWGACRLAWLAPGRALEAGAVEYFVSPET